MASLEVVMQDYFAWFGLEESFEIDSSALKRAYLLKSREVHPDINHGDDQLDLASLNNEAYKTLKNTELRLRYLVDRYDKGVEGENLSPDFLMEMMELNEAIMEVKMGEISDLDSIRARLDSQKMDLQQLIDKYVTVPPADSPDHNWADIRQYLLRWRYLDRLEEQIDLTE